MNTIVYFFTGTGNCLHMAKKLTEKLPDVVLKPIKEGMDFQVPKNAERIGIITPIYFLGLPNMVKNFIEQAHFPKQKDTYYFSIVTFGGMGGNGLAQLKKLLKHKKIQLNYGAGLKAFSNCVTLYNMSKNITSITEKTDTLSLPIIEDILTKRNNEVDPEKALYQWYYGKQMKKLRTKDQNFNISNQCISCNLCQNICPANNIELIQGKPIFKGQCQQCLACLQFCPKKAINYKNRTQNRRRYHHPKITSKELISYNV